MYEVAFSSTSLKSLRRLPVNWRRRIIGKIEGVAEDPHGPQPQVSPLKGRPNVFRIRVGDWRVLYELNDAEQILTVLDVRKREDAYR